MSPQTEHKRNFGACEEAMLGGSDSSLGVVRYYNGYMYRKFTWSPIAIVRCHVLLSDSLSLFVLRAYYLGCFLMILSHHFTSE